MNKPKQQQKNKQSKPTNQNKKRNKRRQRKNQSGLDRQFAPAAINTTVSMRDASLNGRKTMIVSHREMVAQVSGGSTFDISRIPVQPGLFRVFPWLSAVAGAFERYRIRRLDVEYISRSSSTVTGSVYLALDYDNNDNGPATPEAMSTYKGMKQFSFWKDECMRADAAACNTPGPSKYVRIGPVPTDDTQNLYDACTLYIGTQSTDPVYGGDIYFNYEIEFLVAQPIALNSSIISVLATSGIAGITLFGDAMAGPWSKFGILPGTITTDVTTGVATITTTFLGLQPGWNFYWNFSFFCDSSFSGLSVPFFAATGLGIPDLQVCTQPAGPNAGLNASALGQISSSVNAVTITMTVNYGYGLISDNIAQPLTISVLHFPPNTGLNAPFALKKKSQMSLVHERFAKNGLVPIVWKPSKQNLKEYLNETVEKPTLRDLSLDKSNSEHHIEFDHKSKTYSSEETVIPCLCKSCLLLYPDRKDKMDK